MRRKHAVYDGILSAFLPKAGLRLAWLLYPSARGQRGQSTSLSAAMRFFTRELTAQEDINRIPVKGRTRPGLIGRGQARIGITRPTHSESRHILSVGRPSYHLVLTTRRTGFRHGTSVGPSASVPQDMCSYFGGQSVKPCHAVYPVYKAHYTLGLV